MATGDHVNMLLDRNGTLVCNKSGNPLAKLSVKAGGMWNKRLKSIREVRIFAMMRRSADEDELAERREKYRVPTWEVPMLEVMWEGRD
jgi:hypothetical protein